MERYQLTKRDLDMEGNLVQSGTWKAPDAALVLFLANYADSISCPV